ncbi:hypothetical protein EPO15_05255 [bacterium]|nr:MAG: hypothetical protein EPO15_05255 [bacterium]
MGDRGFDRAAAVRWALGGGALLAALLFNYWTGTYVDRIGPTLLPARDLLFEILPYRTSPYVHSWGFAGFLAVLTFGVARYEPRERVPFFLWAYGLIVFTRAFFTVLTPLGVPPEAPTFADFPLRPVLRYFDFRHTFFFSGHTAFPFLGFLLLRRPWVRWACLGFSLLLAGSVLLSRLHYSIDVGAAFFIAYAVAGLSRRSWRSLLLGLGARA